MRNSFCVLFSFLSLGSIAIAMPPADELLLSQVEFVPDTEPKELPEDEIIQDPPKTSEPKLPRPASPEVDESEDNEGKSAPIVPESGRGAIPESRPSDENQIGGDEDAKVVKVTRQKMCQILIETSEVQLELLPSGTILNLEQSGKTFPVRIKRTQRGKILASLKKNDCGRQLQGQSFNYSVGSRLQSRRIEPGAMRNDNQNPTSPQTPLAIPISRPADDGVFLIAGIDYASAKANSYSVYGVRLGYDWFASPRAFRRNKDGSMGGVGLALNGFKDLRDDSFSSNFVGHIFVRYGHRWTTSDFGFGFAPTFKFNFVNSGDDKTEYMPSEYFHRIGFDVQFDYEFTPGVRAVLVGNYLLFPITKESLKELPTFIEALFGFQFLM
jgi:hypothetical protein